jgi:TPR repeat protein
MEKYTSWKIDVSKMSKIERLSFIVSRYVKNQTILTVRFSKYLSESIYYRFIKKSPSNSIIELEKYFNNEQYDKCIKDIKYFAYSGDKKAQYLLGLAYEGEGGGVKGDFLREAFWYTKSAKQGYVNAQINLAVWYTNTFHKNMEEAVFWFKEAAKSKSELAYYSLAIVYDQGDGVEQDIDKAVFYFEKAADLNYSPAVCDLANLYENGDGVEKNNLLALSFYSKACDLGELRAYNLLGLLQLKTGDTPSAEETFRKGAELGCADCEYEYDELEWDKNNQ